MPKSDATRRPVSPLASAMRTASRLNSSLGIAAISGLLEGEYCSQKTRTKPLQGRVAFQFDWSKDFAFLGGDRTKRQVAHIKLSHSRVFLLRAYPGRAAA